jgi:hypothetical protein
MLHSSNLAEARANIALAQQSTKLAEDSRDLGEYTALLAEQTTADSASMITIAAVTMFFLPATFVSVSYKASNLYRYDAIVGLISRPNDLTFYQIFIAEYSTDRHLVTFRHGFFYFPRRWHVEDVQEGVGLSSNCDSTNNSCIDDLGLMDTY